MTGGEITWANVIDKPFIPTEASDIGAKDASYTAYGELGSTYLTKINSSGIYTGTITADQINSYISRVANELTVGDGVNNGTIRLKSAGSAIVGDGSNVTISSMNSIILDGGLGAYVKTNGVNKRILTEGDAVVAKFG